MLYINKKEANDEYEYQWVIGQIYEDNCNKIKIWPLYKVQKTLAKMINEEII